MTVSARGALPEPAPARLLVVEDDPRTAELLALYLRDAGHAVSIAHDGDEGLALALRERPELVVLDLMLPHRDGWSVCRELRAVSDVGIVILSARHEESDRLEGLGLGADDYVVKPFSPREVVLRVQAVLRRLQRTAATRRPTPGRGLVLDEERRCAFRGHQEIALTPSEYRLLETMMGSPGRCFERRDLLQALYPAGGCVVPKVVDVHVGKLRAKLEPEPAKPRFIITVRGFGYRYEEPE